MVITVSMVALPHGVAVAAVAAAVRPAWVVGAGWGGVRAAEAGLGFGRILTSEIEHRIC